VDGPTRTAVCGEAEARLQWAQREFARSVEACRVVREHGSLRVGAATLRRQMRREIGRVLAAFPGVAQFWWAEYRLAEQDGDLQTAWRAIDVAHRLEPEDGRYQAMRVDLAPRALPADQAKRYLEDVFVAIDTVKPAVALLYALGLLRQSPTEETLRRAAHAVQCGLRQKPEPPVGRYLTAVSMLLDELLAGRRPNDDVLYLAGLGDVLAETSASDNLVELLTTLGRDSVARAA
jgi:hypothetical protein